MTCSISLCDAADFSCQERLSDLEYLSLVLIVFGVPVLLAVASNAVVSPRKAAASSVESGRCNGATSLQNGLSIFELTLDLQALHLFEKNTRRRPRGIAT